MIPDSRILEIAKEVAQTDRNKNYLIAFARAVMAEQMECDAVTAWIHYMKTCKKNGHGPDVERVRDFCSSDAIRNQVRQDEQKVEG